MNKNNTIEKKLDESRATTTATHHLLNKNNYSESGENEIKMTTCGVFSNYPPSTLIIICLDAYLRAKDTRNSLTN